MPGLVAEMSGDVPDLVSQKRPAPTLLSGEIDFDGDNWLRHVSSMALSRMVRPAFNPRLDLL